VCAVTSTGTRPTPIGIPSPLKTREPIMISVFVTTADSVVAAMYLRIVAMIDAVQ